MAKLKSTEDTINTLGAVIKATVVQGDNSIKAGVTGDNSATTKKKGRIRIATLEETKEGKLNNVAITPYTLKKITDSLVGSSTYIHDQGIASNTWVINHNLDKKPSITIVDSADNVIEGKETYIDENTIQIEFNSIFKGKAYLN